jgi:hypothetical protein
MELIGILVIGAFFWVAGAHSYREYCEEERAHREQLRRVNRGRTH